MIDTLEKNIQGRYELSDEAYFTTDDEIEIKLDVDYWVKTIIKHNDTDYYLKDFPNLKLEGLIARKVSKHTK